MLPLTDKEKDKLRIRVQQLFAEESTGDLLVRHLFSSRPTVNGGEEGTRLAYQLGRQDERLRVIEDIYQLITQQED